MSLAHQNAENIKKRNKNWSDTNEIRALIYIWEENIEDLMKAKRNRFIYERISTELKGFGFYRSPDETRSKIKNLSAMYRREKLLHAQTGNASEWLYYESIHRFLDHNRSYSEELLNENAVTSPQDTHSLTTGSRGEEREEADASIETVIKEEPIEHVDLDDIILPNALSPQQKDTPHSKDLNDGGKTSSPHQSHAGTSSPRLLPKDQNVEKPSIPTLADIFTQKSPQVQPLQNRDKIPSVQQPLLFLLPRPFVNQKVQNSEKTSSFLQSMNSTFRPIKPKRKETEQLSKEDTEDDDTCDSPPLKRRKKNIEDALENLPLTLQSSILERLDTFNRHIETNTCALSVLSKAVSNSTDSTMRAASAINNLAKAINNVGNTLERLLTKTEE